MGLVGTFSFVKPNERDASHPQKYKDDYRQLENFYNACTRYIRKYFRRDVSGTYHGPQSDQLEKEGMSKLEFPG